MLLGAVTISMLYVIRLYILHNLLPESALSWEVSYIYFRAGVILPLHLKYICVCIDMFVNHKMVSELLCLCMLYNIIVGCT